VKKRTRDAFDIFVSAADQQAEFQTQWEALVYRDGVFRDANNSLWEAIHKKDGVEKILSILNELGFLRSLPRMPLSTRFLFCAHRDDPSGFDGF
jgi:hypothetical protein